jgi:hypothetical protein
MTKSSYANSIIVDLGPIECIQMARVTVVNAQDPVTSRLFKSSHRPAKL